MQDRVSLYPGRVKLEPVAGQANTYDLTRADQPTQEGTPLNKASLLKDTTAALLGLPDTAVPDDAFNVLSRFQKGMGNEYLWEKTTEENNPAYTVNHTTNFGAAVMGATIYYADSFTIINNSFVLTNPQSFVWESYTDVSVANVLRGKFAAAGNSSTTMFANMFKPDSNATFSKGHDNILIVSATEYYNEPHIETVITSYGYVNSPDPNAYPPAVSDGYTYTALGQLGAKVQIAIGSYTGTGTYGSSNPNSLTFDFEPKIWGVLCVKSKSGTFGSLLNINSFLPFGVVGATSSIIGTINSYVSNNTVQNQQITLSGSYNGNTVSWYSVDVDKQLNNSTYEYYYIAIG